MSDQERRDKVRGLLEKVLANTRVREMLAKKARKKGVKDEPDNMQQRRAETRSAMVTVLQWELEKMEKENPVESLKSQLVAALQELQKGLNKALDIEETILTDARINAVFSRRELDHLIRRVAFVSVDADPRLTIPWVVNHLNKSQKIQFIINLRSGTCPPLSLLPPPPLSLAPSPPLSLCYLLDTPSFSLW